MSRWLDQADDLERAPRLPPGRFRVWASAGQASRGVPQRPPFRQISLELVPAQLTELGVTVVADAEQEGDAVGVDGVGDRVEVQPPVIPVLNEFLVGVRTKS